MTNAIIMRKIEAIKNDEKISNTDKVFLIDILEKFILHSW